MTALNPHFAASTIGLDVLPPYLRSSAEQLNNTFEKGRNTFRELMVGKAPILSAATYTSNDPAWSSPASTQPLWLDREYQMPAHVHAELTYFLRSAADADLAEESISDFMVAFEELLALYGPQFLNLLEEAIWDGTVPSLIASDILRHLGSIVSPQTHGERLGLLLNLLEHESPRVRYGATLGLASLDDELALPYVRVLLNRERVPEVTNAMKLLCMQLER